MQAVVKRSSRINRVSRNTKEDLINTITLILFHESCQNRNGVDGEPCVTAAFVVCPSKWYERKILVGSQLIQFGLISKHTF